MAAHQGNLHPKRGVVLGEKLEVCFNLQLFNSQTDRLIFSKVIRDTISTESAPWGTTLRIDFAWRERLLSYIYIFTVHSLPAGLVLSYRRESLWIFNEVGVQEVLMIRRMSDAILQAGPTILLTCTSKSNRCVSRSSSRRALAMLHLLTAPDTKHLLITCPIRPGRTEEAQTTRLGKKQNAEDTNLTIDSMPYSISWSIVQTRHAERCEQSCTRGVCLSIPRLDPREYSHRRPWLTRIKTHPPVWAISSTFLATLPADLNFECSMLMMRMPCT